MTSNLGEYLCIRLQKPQTGFYTKSSYGKIGKIGKKDPEDSRITISPREGSDN